MINSIQGIHQMTMGILMEATLQIMILILVQVLVAELPDLSLQ